MNRGSDRGGTAVNVEQRIRRLLEALPSGASVTLERATLEDWLSAAETPTPAAEQPLELATAPEDWRAKLWRVPAETRLGVEELAEALGRPKSFVYDHTRSDASNPLPHRKLTGVLSFTAGEVRTWIREHEAVVVACPMESTPDERRLRIAS